MKSSPPILKAIRIFMLSDAEDKNTTGAPEQVRIWAHQW